MHLTLQCTLEKNQAESDTSLIQLLRDMIRDGKTKAIYLWIPLHAVMIEVVIVVIMVVLIVVMMMMMASARKAVGPT